MSDIDQRYSDIKAGALGTLPERLAELISRTPDVRDKSLLLSTTDRLDVLAGDFAYNYILKEGP